MISQQQALYGLTTDHLTTLASGFLLHHQVVEAFTSMQKAANEVGFDLRIASSFRDFERQKAIWNGKFCGARPILDINNNPVDITPLDDWQTCQAILLYSALPGASRHHWGTDFDYYDGNNFDDNNQLQLIEPEYQHKGPCAKLCQWLFSNAKEFGFYFPYRHYLGGIACEPWHLSYFPIAQQFEQQLTPAGITELLIDTDIEGKNAIIQHIEHIYNMYINNLSDSQS